MADFFNDEYASIGSLGGAVKGAIQGWQDAEDRKMKRMEMEARMEAHKAEKERNEFLDQLTMRDKGFAKDPATGQLVPDVSSRRTQAIEKLAPHGLVPQLDEQGNVTGTSYDPEYLKMKNRETSRLADPYGLKGMEQEKRRIELQKLNAQAPYENLPKDKQIEVDKLSNGIASRRQIRADIDSALSQLQDESKSSDEKLLIGRELLKTLNSTLGADAIGQEEARRLGSLLEFKIIPRIGEPGNWFGRDLNMFTEQVKNNRNRLEKTEQTMQAEIDRLMGRDQPQSTAGLVPAGLLKKRGLLERAAGAVVPEAGASTNKIKVSNGRETYFIEPKDEAAARADGFKRVK